MIAVAHRHRLQVQATKTLSCVVTILILGFMQVLCRHSQFCLATYTDMYCSSILQNRCLQAFLEEGIHLLISLVT